MTVSTIDNVIEYVDGGPDFPIPYRFLRDEDIQVELTTPNGLTETLSAAQYSLVGSGSAGGGTMTSAYASSILALGGAILTVSRIMAPLQPIDLRNQGRYLAETQETGLDRLTMLIQQGINIASRALRRPVGKNYYDAQGRQIKNLGDPTLDQDATTKKYVDYADSEISSRVDALSAGLPGTNYAFPWSTITTQSTKVLTPGFTFASATLSINGATQTFGRAYVVVNNTIVLAEAIPAGTEISAVLGQYVIPTVDNGNPVAFATYADLRAYDGPEGTLEVVGQWTKGTFRQISFTPAGFTDDNGFTLITNKGWVFRRIDTLVIHVDWFLPTADGTTDDIVAFTAAANCAQALKNGTNRTPIIELGNRTYYLGSATPAGTWWLPPGADINGLPGVSPSFQTDTSRLIGTIFRFSGIDQYGTVYVGDPIYNNQKKTGRVLAAQLMGASNRAAGGLAGFTYTSARDGADQSSIGVAGQGYNDNTTTPKTAWGLYGEGIRALSGTGNAFGVESSTFNYAPVVTANPYQQPGEATGVTVAAWLSALGTVDSTAALGIITAGKKFDRGIVFFSNSLVGNEAVAMPYGYKIGWHLSSSSGMASYVQSDILQQYAVNGPCYMRGVRGGATSVNNDLIRFESWSGNNGGAEVVLADSRLYQVSNFAGGFAGSRWDWSVRNAAGVTTRIYLSATAHRPETTNAVSSGEQGSSWSAVYATQVRPGAGAVIWTSGSGTPEGAVTAPVGSMFTRTDGGANTTLYVKETGAGNTGWVAK